MIDKKELQLTVGANVRRLRKLKGVTQTQFAEAVECSQSFVTQLEKGECGCTDAMLFTIADYFGVPTDTLRQVAKKSAAAS